MTQDMTVDDPVTGLLAHWATRGVRTMTGGLALHRLILDAYRELTHLTDTGLDLRFVVILDELHGWSPDVAAALDRAAVARLVAPDGPELRLAVDPGRAARILERLPGGPGLYAHLAHRTVISV